MKKLIHKSFSVVLLILLGVLPMLTLSASAEYAETAEWINENPRKNDDYAFSIAVVGDTQTLVEMDTANGTSYTASIYDWIVANKEEKNMQYVLGLGDITQYDTDEEWTYAKSHITKLNGVVPYTLVRGGLPHDSEGQFDKYFANESGYTENLTGYYEEGSIVNTYSTFAYGAEKYLIFSLDFAAVDEVLNWASGIIESDEFKDHKVIITTHCYIWRDGNPCTQKTPSSAIPDKAEYTSDDKYNNGDELWDKFISKHENIFLTLSGHFESNDVIASQAVGDNGNIVTQMMINPQGFDYNQGGETGMVCMLYFSADGSVMSVEWYSTYRNQYYKPSNQFDIDLSTMSLGGGMATKYGYIPARHYDPDNYPYALFKKTPSVGSDGTKYDYTLYGTYKSLTGDSALGAASSESAYHVAREKTGDGSVILMLRDVVNTDTGNYSNLQYHPGSLTLDLGGYTMTDAHTYSTALFFCHMKTSDNHMRLTVKNGTLLVGNNGLTQYDGFTDKSNCSLSVDFKDMTIGYAKGSLSTYLIKSYAATKEYSGLFPVSFDCCKIDMTNAPAGAKIATSTSGETVTVTNSKIVGGDLAYNVNEYGYAAAKPADNELIAVYKKVAGSPKVDGVTYPSEYTFYGYYKALYADSNLGVTTATGAFNAARTVTEKGNEAAIVLLDNHEVTTTSAYNNMCYNMKDIVFDLRGYTLTDSNNDTVTIFYMYARIAGGANSVFTVKNGNVVLGKDAIASFIKPDYDFTMGLVFDSVNFSWKEDGTKAGYFIGATSYRDTYPLTFNNCTIDLKNASTTMKLENNGTLAGISFNNTKIINSTDPSVYTADENDAFDGNYVIGEYGIIPLSIDEATDVYPFIAYKNSSVTINGITYSYSYYGAYKVLTGDSAIGVTADAELGFASLRYAGNGAVLLMRRDYVYSADKIYSNLCYSGASVTFDLGGFTLHAAHSHGTGLLENHVRGANQNTTITLKNGNVVIYKKGLTSYSYGTGGAASYMGVVFDNLHISFAEGATATNLIGAFKLAEGRYSVSFINCVIDLENAPAGFNLAAQNSCVGGIELTLTDTGIINSKVIAPKHNLTLYNDFKLNAYVPIATANAAVSITSIEFGGLKYDTGALEIVTVNGVSYYKITLDVAPNAAFNTKTLRVNLDYVYTYSNGTTNTVSSYLDWEFSVLTYLEAVIGTEGEKMDTLAKDILSYIRAVYIYEDSSDATEASAIIDGIIGADYNDTSRPTDVDEKLIIDGMSSARVYLDSSPAFIFYPELDAEGNPVYSLDRYVFALDGKYRLTATLETDDAGKTYFLIRLPAYAINGTIEYIVNGTSIHGYYNLQAYYNYFADSGNTNLITLIERLRKYGESAEIYKNSLI